MLQADQIRIKCICVYLYFPVQCFFIRFYISSSYASYLRQIFKSIKFQTGISKVSNFRNHDNS